MKKTINYFTKEVKKITQSEMDYVVTILPVKNVKKLYVFVDKRSIVTKSTEESGYTMIDIFTRGKSIEWITQVDSNILNA